LRRFDPSYPDKSIFSGFNQNLVISATGIWHYPAQVTDTVNVKPVMTFIDTGNVESVAAAEITVGGRKELHMFMDQASWSLHSAVCNSAM